ncbi:uncharacterized protein LOC135681025 isoform X2 [Rhopilema esculentum]|uniref:uncharacterized protein LOC135681025 isoform X2 n=1 Tax=Rhopilema esculentum TaxID=499914 RepID=UPI0031D067AA
MADIVSEIVLDGGGPWGFRLQGGKDFGIPLNVSRVTPGSKAALKQMVVGDIICEINGFNMESLSHMEAQNHIKNAGSTLNMKIRKGKGISVGDQNAMSFGSAGSPKVLTETNVIHSASVDHTFNPKPKPFNFGTNSPTVTQGVSPQKSSPAPPAQAPKFDPGAYARKKKEELEQRKKAESTVAEDSDILKMINATSISKSPSPTSHSQTEASSSPQDFIDALKQRLRSEATNENQNNGQTCSRQDDSSHQAISPSTSSHFTSTQIPQPPPTPLIPSYQTRPPAKTNASYLQMPLTHVNQDAPPINKDHVFKMSYETRDIHAADISMGSMNVMNSLKEKLALKSATGSNYEVATKTPSRVHAMLNEQLGYEEEEREERFHSDQTRTVPSKVFQALQYAYPSSEDNAPGAQKEKRYQENSLKQEDEEEYVRFRSSQTNTVPSKVFKALQYSYPTKSAAPLDPVYQQMQEERSGHQPYRTDQRQYKDAYEEEDGYGRFVGNPTNKVPSKVFQALQYSYDTPQTIETNSDTNVVHNVDPGYLKYSNHVPSKSFQRLQKQYNDEKEKRSEAIPGDLQDAIDLLEKELDAMTSSKTNPVIMVPLNRGLNRGQRPSEELSPVCPAENPAVQVPLHAHSTKDGPLARNNQQLNQAISFAPPVPVRIDSKRFQHQPRMSTGEDVVYQAPVAKVQGLPQRPANQHRSTSNSQDDEVIQAPVAHLENVVAYSAEFETPWIMPVRPKEALPYLSPINLRLSVEIKTNGRTPWIHPVVIQVFKNASRTSTRILTC